MTQFKKFTVLALAGTMLASGPDRCRHGRRHERYGAHERERGAMTGFRAGERFARADTDGDRMISL
jgi:hypothetical protein